ncbi:sensor histidine kinase [Calidifontibacillus oryziterrae]|uniref:sensor histidine kinase n=1 Tax=Calidifontibacillus oryziterrae TaxID=1191699 RepID=UPI0002F7B028|nr:sensor histidine kinase [Calidifontibacillus oryziterrae]
MSIRLNEKVLDKILEKMIETVANSKKEIFEIGEQSRQEFEILTKELQRTRQEVVESIEKGERLEISEKFSRQRLSEVSKHFKKYSEEQIREAYEAAHKLQMELSFLRQNEKMLIERRNELERRLKNLEKTVARAENLVGQISVVLNYLTSDLKLVNEMLEDAKVKQEFGLRIIEAQEEERKRLSREIHDGPAQMLANVMMRSELIERISREKGMEEALKEVKDLKQMVRSALYEVRKIIYDLRPMALDDLGLIPTLKRYLSTIEEYNNIQINFLTMGKDKRLSPRLEVALFRLVQEAVQNAVKHAAPKEIQVKIEITKSKCTLIIKDDGKGFDIYEKKEKSFGLVGMRERVELLKGEMTIDSAINKGTLIMILVPLMDDEKKS